MFTFQNQLKQQKKICTFNSLIFKWDSWWIWFISCKYRNFYLLPGISTCNTYYVLLFCDLMQNQKWYVDNQPTTEGIQLGFLTSLYGMKQLILESTCILEISSSYIDLIFTNHPNLVMDSGVHPSLIKCYHQIIYSKLNLTYGIMIKPILIWLIEQLKFD